MEKDLNVKWKEFNTEEFVNNVVDGKQNPKIIEEARELMNETIKNREETQDW